jgi:TolA-binding protein
MHLVWRTPTDAPDALPVTVPASAFIQSGRTRIVSAQTRSGGPVAMIEIEPESYLWLGAQPVNLYRLRAAQTTSHPAGTVYVWNFGDGRQLKGKEVLWLVGGDAPVPVQLTVSSPKGTSKTTRPLYFDRPPGRAVVRRWKHRRVYRAALLQYCQAVPANRRPCQDWTADFWTTLLEVSEPYQSYELLNEIFRRSRADVLDRPPAERIQLEELFWSTLRGTGAAARTDVERWLDQFIREEPDRARQFEWRLRRVEWLLYDRQELDAARQAANDLKDLALAAGVEATVRWLVRGADIERLAGHYDAARRLYADAGDRFREGRADWRAEAVRQGSFYETARNLIAQGAYFEAQDVLRQWEIEFPLSKLDGDYPLVEAEYWIAIDRCDQAVRGLRSYRGAVTLSGLLPDAMKLELDCLVKLKRPEDLKALSDDINKRFPTLDLARQAKELVEKK